MAHERKCTVCGTTYSYCPRCKQYAADPIWKMNYCSQDCKDLYSTVDKFIFKHISAEDAKKALSGNKVQVKNDELKKIIASIYVSEDKEKKNKKKTNEIVNEE